MGKLKAPEANRTLNPEWNMEPRAAASNLRAVSWGRGRFLPDVPVRADPTVRLLVWSGSVCLADRLELATRTSTPPSMSVTPASVTHSHAHQPPAIHHYIPATSVPLSHPLSYPISCCSTPRVMFIYGILIVVTAASPRVVVGGSPEPVLSPNSAVSITGPAAWISTRLPHGFPTPICAATPTAAAATAPTCAVVSVSAVLKGKSPASSPAVLEWTSDIAGPSEGSDATSADVHDTTAALDSTFDTGTGTGAEIGGAANGTPVLPGKDAAATGDGVSEFCAAKGTPASIFATHMAACARPSITRRADGEPDSEEHVDPTKPDKAVTQTTGVGYQPVSPTGSGAAPVKATGLETHRRKIAEELNKLEALEEDGMLLPQEEARLKWLRSPKVRVNGGGEEKKQTGAVPLVAAARRENLEVLPRGEIKAKIRAKSLCGDGPPEEEAEHSSLGDTVDSTEVETLEDLEGDEEILPFEEARLSTLHASAADETDWAEEAGSFEAAGGDFGDDPAIDPPGAPSNSDTRSIGNCTVHETVTVIVGAAENSAEHGQLSEGFGSESRALTVTETERGIVTEGFGGAAVEITIEPSTTGTFAATDGQGEEPENEEEKSTTREKPGPEVAKPHGEGPDAAADEEEEEPRRVVTQFTTGIVTLGGGNAPYATATRVFDIVLVHPTPLKGSELQNRGSALRFDTRMGLLAGLLSVAVVLEPHA